MDVVETLRSGPYIDRGRLVPVRGHHSMYGEGADTETPEAEAGSLSFCRLSWCVVLFLGFSGGFPTPLDLF